MASTTRVLLPTNVKPVSYAIHLTPKFEDFTFTGVESVQVTVLDPTSVITMHSKEIDVKSARVTTCDAVFDSTDISYDEELETVSFTFASDVPAGDATIAIEFIGQLNDQMAGFYRSKYQVDGEDRWMATTQMEPTDARRAFPCWDEPAVKAKFTISLTIPSDRNALSNMPVKSEHVDGAVKTLHFEQTPIMSTYLIAFVIGEFEHVEGTTDAGVQVRVHTPLGKKDQGRFALDVAVKTLDYYSEYYGVGYPLPKSDMIAIPDFSAGAMENWGLITYRETALLIDEAQSSVSQKQRVAYVVAHELAHQWFGNLVTMEWWRELWLNEGFATFVGNQAVAKFFPEWSIWTQFVSDYSSRALKLDALINTHPIEVDVASSSQVNEIFDAISYCKGAAAIRMVFDFIGEDAFREGLNAYLNRHKYGNAVTTDLWRAFGDASGKPVADLMGPWTGQPGYPVVSIARGDEEGAFVVKQRRFLASGDEAKEPLTWWLHINFISSTTAEHESVDVSKHEQVVLVKCANGAKWVKANAEGYGFYRVAYSEDLLAELQAALPSLSTVDRLTLQNDAFALARAGIGSGASALSLANAYVNEEEYTVWSDIADSIGGMATVWASEPEYDNFKMYQRALFGPTAHRLGWEKKEGESDLAALLRSIALSKMGSAGDPDVVAQAIELLKASKEDPSALPADLRGMVYRIAVSHGGVDEWDMVHSVFSHGTMHEERMRALSALGRTKDEELRSKVLHMALDPQVVRTQDLVYAIAGCAASPDGREATWTFLQDNWKRVEELLGGGAFLLGRVIAYTVQDFNTEAKAAEVEAFFAANPCPPAERTIKQSCEHIRSNAAWLERDREAVKAYLDAFSK